MLPMALFTVSKWIQCGNPDDIDPSEIVTVNVLLKDAANSGSNVGAGEFVELGMYKSTGDERRWWDLNTVCHTNEKGEVQATVFPDLDGFADIEVSKSLTKRFSHVGKGQVVNVEFNELTDETYSGYCQVWKLLDDHGWEASQKDKPYPVNLRDAVTPQEQEKIVPRDGQTHEIPCNGPGYSGKITAKCERNLIWEDASFNCYATDDVSAEDGNVFCGGPPGGKSEDDVITVVASVKDQRGGAVKWKEVRALAQPSEGSLPVWQHSCWTDNNGAAKFSIIPSLQDASVQEKAYVMVQLGDPGYEDVPDRQYVGEVELGQDVSVTFVRKVVCQFSEGDWPEGVEVPSGTLQAGDTRVLSCKDGYPGKILAGCHFDGEWGASGSCDKVVCLLSEGNWPDGLEVPNELLYAGDTDVLSCKNGYDGSVLAECNSDGEMEVASGGCDAICQFSEGDWPEGVNVPSGTLKADDEERELSCKDGYTGEVSVKCSSGGEWKVSGSCDKIVCQLSEREWPDGLDVPSETLQPGDTEVLSCKDGYPGSVLAKCNSDGEMEVVSGGCGGSCPFSTIEVDSKWKERLAIPTGILEPGEEEELGCKPGYTGGMLAVCEEDAGPNERPLLQQAPSRGLTGCSEIVECSESDLFDNKLPEGLENLVDDLPGPNFPVRQPGYTKSLSCKDGYTGEVTATCTSSGEWEITNTCGCPESDLFDNKLPEALQSVLDIPGPSISLPVRQPGYTKSLSCKAGYTGEVTATCTSSRGWEVTNACGCSESDLFDNKLPEGLENLVDDLPGPNFPVRQPGYTKSLPCNDGYTGEVTATCTSSRGWDVTNNCEEINKCQFFEGEWPGVDVPNGWIKVDEEEELPCQEGWTGGPVTAKCMSGERWLISGRCFEDYDCSDPSDVANYFQHEIQENCQANPSSFDQMDEVQKLNGGEATGPVNFDEYRIVVGRPNDGWRYLTNSKMMDLLKKQCKDIDEHKPPQCDEDSFGSLGPKGERPAFTALLQATSGIGFKGDQTIEEGSEYTFFVNDFNSGECHPDAPKPGPALACELPVACSYVGSTSLTFVTGTRKLLLDTNFHTVNGARTFFVEDGESEDEVVIGTRAAARAHNPALKNTFIKQFESGGTGEKAEPDDVYEAGKDVWVGFFEQIDRWLGKRSNSGRNCHPNDGSCSCKVDWSELTGLDFWSRLC